MRGNVIETVMGAVVLVVAAVFLFFAYSTSQLRAVSGYELTADFERIDGIKEGSDVRVSGIKVGTVVSETLDPTTYDAIVKLSVDPSADPKTIDLTSRGGVSKVSPGIYRLSEDGSKLEICRGDWGGKKRPTKFSTKPGVGSGSFLTVFKREKD